jgi:hypothetical protein
MAKPHIVEDKIMSMMAAHQRTTSIGAIQYHVAKKTPTVPI